LLNLFDYEKQVASKEQLPIAIVKINWVQQETFILKGLLYFIVAFGSTIILTAASSHQKKNITIIFP